MIPASQTEIQAPAASKPEIQLAALLHGAAIAPLNDIGWIRVSGDDRVRWLNGMVTNSIHDLQPGNGNYNFLLSAQGRIQGDATIFAQADSLVLETAATQVSSLITLLDRFIIMDDVELTDISAASSGLLIAGSEAAKILAQLNLATANINPLQFETLSWQGNELTSLQAYSPLVPRFELWANANTIAAITIALQQAGAAPVTHESLEYLRLLEGTPSYGTDIRTKELPQETAQARALHFSKGCYLGQEIVERIHSRGNVHRTFTAFKLEGTLPPAGTHLESEGKQIGELTSAAAIPLQSGPVQLALGYVRREALEKKSH